jgi:hypothetical protein
MRNSPWTGNCFQILAERIVQARLLNYINKLEAQFPAIVFIKDFVSFFIENLLKLVFELVCQSLAPLLNRKM